MSDGFTGIDPERLRALGDLARTAADLAASVGDEVATAYLTGDLEGTAASIAGELAEELGMLAGLCSAKATDIELAASGVMSPLAALAMLDLQASLADAVGASGLAGDQVLAAAAANFSKLDADGDGEISGDDLEAAASSSDPDVRAVAGYLRDNPMLFAFVASATTSVTPNSDGNVNPFWPQGLPADVETISLADLTAAVEQNRVLRVLADRSLFDALDDADPADLDRLISTDDVDRLLESADDPEVIAALTYLRDHQAFFERLDAAGPTQIHGSGFPDGLFSFNDLLSLTVNQQAFAADPAAASDFVLGLDHTWDEMNGKLPGYDIRLSSDEGVRALAASALSAASTLTKQTIVVASLPESPGGERNRLINYYYSVLGEQLDIRLNVGAVPPGTLWVDRPGYAGHTGANWLQWGVAASTSLHNELDGSHAVFGFNPSWSDRQYLANGNAALFGDIAPRTAMFLDAFPAGEPITAKMIDDFFNKTYDPARPLEPTKLFREGHDQLRDGFAHYLAAMTTDDPVERQRLTLLANTYLGAHEQATVQNALDHIFDSGWREDGWFRTFAGETGDIVGRGDSDVATDQVAVDLAEGVTIPMDHDLDPGHSHNNTVQNASLTDDLNPALPTEVAIGDVTVGLRGHDGDVTLPYLGGWDDPPEGSGMEEFPIDTRIWDERGRNGADRSAGDALDGSGAGNWTSAPDRMYSIASLFQQHHADPALWQGSAEHWPGSSEYDDHLAYLPDNVIKATGQ